jgi:hypothetical protein
MFYIPGMTNFTGTFAGNGSGLTNLNVTTATGTLPIGVLTKIGTNAYGVLVTDGAGNQSYTNAPTLNVVNMTGLPTTNSVVQTNDTRALNLTNAGNVFGGTFNGNGAGVTNLNATNLTGTVPLARLPNLPIMIAGAFSIPAAMTAGNIFFAISGSSQNTSSANCSTPLSWTGYITNLFFYVSKSGGAGVGTNYVFRFYTNNIVTDALSCTATGSSVNPNIVSNTMDSITIYPGMFIAVCISNTIPGGSTLGTGLGWSFQIHP